jgi:hypothetical protein
MKSALRSYETAEDTDMPANESDGLGELRADVRHIHVVVTDIKADLRVTNQRIDSLDQKFDQKFDSFRKEITEFRKETTDKFSEIKDSLASAKLWAFGLYVGLAGMLLYVLARGFKWI